MIAFGRTTKTLALSMIVTALASAGQAQVSAEEERNLEVTCQSMSVSACADLYGYHDGKAGLQEPIPDPIDGIGPGAVKAASGVIRKAAPKVIFREVTEEGTKAVIEETRNKAAKKALSDAATSMQMLNSEVDRTDLSVPTPPDMDLSTGTYQPYSNPAPETLTGSAVPGLEFTAPEGPFPGGPGGSGKVRPVDLSIDLVEEAL